MKTLRSKLSILQTTLLVGVGVILFGVTGVVLITQFIRDHDDNKTFMLVLVAIGALAFSLYSLYYFLTALPTIEISDEKITIKTPFKRMDILFKDIQSIGLLRKSPMSFMLITMPMESTSIMTKDFNETIIWDDYYRNISDIKVRLEKIKIGIRTGEFKFDDEATIKETPIDLRNENFIEIKGNGLLNLYAVMFWVVVIVWVFALDFKIPSNVFGIGLTVFIFSLFYAFSGYQLNYYRVSDNYFQVRNHLWFWKRRTFRIKDLKEVVFEEPHRLANTLRVITTDFKRTLHPGGSLRDKHWIELRENLQKKGIEVRDELKHY